MITEFFKEIGRILNSDHPFYLIMSDVWNLLLTIWHYKIYVTVEKQEILVSNVVVSIILFLVGIKIVKHIRKILKHKLSKKIMEPGIVNSLSQLIYYFLMIVMIVFVLDLSNVPLTIFTVVGTTLALGIGLGSKEIVNNFMSGIIIMIERPIKVGDIVEVKGIAGEVTHIGARCTTIRTNKNISILVPNSNVLQNVVVNWTLEDTILKTNITLNVGSDVDIEKVDNLIIKILNDSSNVLKDPKPLIYLIDFNANSYEIEVDFCIDLALNLKIKTVVDDINRALLSVFKENNITILEKSSFVCGAHQEK